MSGSTLPARALGRLLSGHRERVGMTKYAAGQLVDTSQQTVARIEYGLKSKVSQLWINVWADAYKVSDDERKLMLGLAQELASSRRNWWRAYVDEMNPHFDYYLGLEQAARALSVWRTNLLPGLLQTPEYRRAVAWTESPEMTTEQVEKRVEMAVRRQTRLDDQNFTVDVILSQSGLLDQIGGGAVMSDQLERLAELAARPNVSIRVVPFGAPRHLGLRVGSFAMLEFPRLPATGMIEPPVIYIEGYTGDLYLEQESDVTQFRDAFAEISRVALDRDTTRRLLLSMAKEHKA
ncbi:helix-turn-helix domain-containing protein [Nocardia acidivorans]|uniref:helix-turn-helix domain-containing protein n=1 Tax=Nocardia acidivorans TaxID=404580 RepID=UPI000835140C|nr:helix-turn-helix transcriptional regulator [Nocardia acidivorans]